MTLRDFLKAWDEQGWGKREIVAHFRFATHGAKSIANCHPWPVDKGSMLYHNGVISGFGSEELSDSGEFASVLGTLKPERRLAICEAVADSGQKFALFHGGEWHLIGRFEELRKGVMCSNLHWTPSEPRASRFDFRETSKWDDARYFREASHSSCAGSDPFYYSSDVDPDMSRAEIDRALKLIG